jgi:hypothetical protein
MRKPSLEIAVEELATSDEKAGFTVEQMIQLLNIGLRFEALLELIAWRLEAMDQPLAAASSVSCWIA